MRSKETIFRPMRRFRQELPLLECRDILTKAYRGFLSVVGDVGYPYTVPVNFLYADGHLWFHSALEGDMVKNGPRAAMLDFDIEHVCGKRVREK